LICIVCEEAFEGNSARTVAGAEPPEAGAPPGGAGAGAAPAPPAGMLIFMVCLASGFCGTPMRTVAFFFEGGAGAPGRVSPCIVAYGSGSSAMALTLFGPLLI